MLNELAVVSASLERVGVAVVEPHPWIKPLPKSERLVIGIDAEGRPSTVELLPLERAVQISYIYKSNHQIFPGMNWPCPVVVLHEGNSLVQRWLSTDAKKVSERLAPLGAAVAEAAIEPQQNHVLRRLRSFCSELQQAFEGAVGQFAAFPELLRRIVGVDASSETWFRQLVFVAVRAAESSPGLLALVEKLVAGFDAGSGRLALPKDKLKVPVFFDLSDCTRFPMRVADRDMASFLSERLKASEVGGREGVCAISGQPTRLVDDKLPSPKLLVLGNTYLMSMNADEPCHFRYGRSSVDVFPIGRDTASRLNASLLYLADPLRKGKTWNPVPGKQGVLFAYLEADPSLNAELASFFSEPEEAEASYDTLCATVCRALAGRPSGFSDMVRVFVLSRLDLGRVQVALADSFSAAQVVEGAEEWQRAAASLPWLGPLAPASAPTPVGVMEVTRRVWVRAGEKAADAPGCGLRQVLDILVARMEGAHRSAAQILRHVLRGSQPLLVSVGHELHRGTRLPVKRVAASARACSVLGICLQKLGYRKENYMSEQAFHLGRFLSLADTLHREYCENVREKKLPPQLLGNSLIPAVIVHPERALAQMIQRLRVYQAWAKTRGSGLARWALGEMGRIATGLSQQPLPTRMDDAAKAQLLLGYLARPEKGEAGDDDKKGDGKS